MKPLLKQTSRSVTAGRLGVRGLANVAYGIARTGLGESAKSLFATLARAAKPRLGEFNAQGLVSSAWAFATAGHLDEELFATLGRAAMPRLCEFNVQGLANTV